MMQLLLITFVDAAISHVISNLWRYYSAGEWPFARPPTITTNDCLLFHSIADADTAAPPLTPPASDFQLNDPTQLVRGTVQLLRELIIRM